MRPIIASDRRSVRGKPDLPPFRSFSRSPGLTDSFHKLHDAPRVDSPPSTAWSLVRSTGQRLALESGFRFTHEEGGPDKIDVELVVHGPALTLFEQDKIDPELQKRFDQALKNGVHAEMCQISMKLYNTPLEKLAKGFVATLHPVAVKRIADLQTAGYLYIKP